ncbi:MAG: 30S ribosomal protein S2, partial [Victivallales bacterium]|nr:30S ribosomal protein S2 [Victivallales bacterium]
MAKITIKDLLEAGCHFGHQTKRWNPKMKDYVFGAKNGISIIDLTKTMHQIADSCNFLQRVVADGGDILFVGTKRQAQQIIREIAEKTKMYYVSERWMGGILTNNTTIRKSINRMNEIDKRLSDGGEGGLKKKELITLSRKGEKLHRNLDGIAEMKKLPAAMVVVDVCNDAIAVREANKLNIPIVAIVDTNGDPSNIDYPVAANDDAVKSIKIITDLFADAIVIAAEMYHKKVVEERAKAEAEAKAKAAEKEAAAQEKAAKEAEAKAKAAEKKAAAKEKKAAEKTVEEAAAVAEDQAEAEAKTAAKKTVAKKA